ncbi:MAG: Mth938-like domain-containing protein [Candidatus Caldatribacteriota bacterium]|nr:Mth938-like domain-containing protein [Candidatus Caldatribacteriota bacterium]
MIESYNFGKIIINSKEYHSDIIIYKDSINDKWWRKVSHNLCIEDIQEIFDKKPEVLIIGTGYYGLMKVPLELIKYLESNNIKVIIKRTKNACDEYNTLYQKKNVIAAFHLTC